MTPNEYQALAMRTKCDQEAAVRRFLKLSNTSGVDAVGSTWLAQLNHAALGLAGDAGELSNAVARCVYYGKELDITNIKEEIGDCLWWLAEACDAMGVTMEEMMEANIRKLQARYPDKYTNEHAAEKNRDREAERRAIETVHDPVVGDVEIAKLTSKDVDEITRLPKPGPKYICPKCGSLIGKTLRELVYEWQLKDYREPNVHKPYPCPDCGKPLVSVVPEK